MPARARHEIDVSPGAATRGSVAVGEIEGFAATDQARRRHGKRGPVVSWNGAGGDVPGALSRMPTPEGVDADHWRRLIESAPWLTVSDTLVCVALCHALSEYWEARREVAKFGVMALLKSGDLAPNPWVAVMTARRAEIVKIAKDLGLNPIVRMR